MAPLTSQCPGCGARVPVLPPRSPGHPRPLGWRREPHSSNGLALNAAMAKRCRYPAVLPPTEHPDQRGPMQLNIYARRHPKLIQPGDIVAADENLRPLEISEVRALVSSSGGLRVELYGLPPGSDKGRRQCLTFEDGGLVPVLPSPDTVPVLWGLIIDCLHPGSPSPEVRPAMPGPLADDDQGNGRPALSIGVDGHLEITYKMTTWCVVPHFEEATHPEPGPETNGFVVEDDADSDD